MIAPGTAATAESPPLGRWQFTSYRYRGEERPRPNPALLLFFEFNENGDDHLWWSHEGDTDHCERRGRFEVADGILEDWVVWVSPDNTVECGGDPDMQNGRRTKTPYRLNGDRLETDLGLGDDIFTYIWERR